MKTLIRSINRSPLRCGFFSLATALCWLALSPPLKAQCPSACGSGGNTAVGINALDSVTTGINNTALGTGALTADTGGDYNVAVGNGALQSNTTGFQNMAIGAEALADNIVGNFNMGIGFRALFMNTGSRNSAVGAAALRNNTTASDNTAIGSTAMRENTTGETNTAIGSAALTLNTTSGANVAVGDAALTVYNGLDAGIDGFNTALGSIALTALTEGFQNTAVGRRALQAVTVGNNNVAVGWRTGNILTTGNGNTFLGTLAGSLEGPNVDNVICLGESGDTNGGEQTSNRCYIGQIFGITTGNVGSPVLIDFDGQLGTISSSRRFKKDIKPMDQASEAILALKPVTFHYKDRRDGKKAQETPEFGLIAEDVAEVNPDLVVNDKNGEIYSVRYEVVNVMLLNEFLKEHKKVEEQQASIADLKSTVALQQKGMEVLTAQLKEQAAQIQKVSAQLEASKPAPKVVANK
jgi:trimeric autotransporter adhesin